MEARIAQNELKHSICNVFCQVGLKSDRFSWNIYSIDNKSNESINLAKKALKSNPQYVSKDYQAKQLWGKKLQKSAEVLFKTTEMKKVVNEAKEKSQ